MEEQGDRIEQDLGSRHRSNEGEAQARPLQERVPFEKLRRRAGSELDQSEDVRRR